MNFRDSEYLVPIFDFDLLNLQLNTPLFIFALVLVVMFFLNRWLFQPVLRTLDARGERLTELQSAAAGQQEEIDRLAADYEQKLERVRAEVAQVRQDARREAQEATEAILYRARQEADQELRTALSELEGEVTQATSELGGLARDLAGKAVARILRA